MISCEKCPFLVIEYSEKTELKFIPHCNLDYKQIWVVRNEPILSQDCKLDTVTYSLSTGFGKDDDKESIINFKAVTHKFTPKEIE